MLFKSFSQLIQGFINKFTVNGANSLKKSSLEEDYEELEQLLQNIVNELEVSNVYFNLFRISNNKKQ